MRIGFDLRPAFRKNSRRRGIGVYSRELLHALLEANRDHEFVLYNLPGCSFEQAARCLQRSIPHLSKPSRLNWVLDRLVLTGRLVKDRLDLFHATEITSIPRSDELRVWAHVHDLIPFVFWEETRRRVPWDYARGLRSSLKRIQTAERIITDSKHSKSDICRRLGIDEKRVHVVYPSCGPVFRPLDQDSCRRQLESRYSITDPFVFYVGGSDFRKNLSRLVGAFASFRRLGYRGKLVLAGETFRWDIEEVNELRGHIGRVGLKSAVIFPGYVPQADLPLFYNGCDFFIFPSLYEGFGLPVLEAIRCHTPVLTANRSSLPEVAGKAAEYFEPEDEQSIVEAFSRVHENESRLEELRAACRQQGLLFSWETAARQIHELYDSVTAG